MIKRALVILLGLFILIFPHGLASAHFQVLPNLFTFGGNGCNNSCGNPLGLSIAGDVAYVGYSRSTSVTFSSQGPGLAGFTEWRHGYPVHGIQLGGTITASPANSVILIARGTWLLPWNGESFENYKFDDITLERSWRTNTQWWTAEAAAAYAMNSASAVIGGLRYDSFMTNFKDPVISTFGSPQDQADLQASLWIPFVGIVVDQGFVRFGLIGTPWLPGNIRYRQTLSFPDDRVSGNGSVRDGYFLETWAEFNTNFMGASAGIFAKYTLVHARSTASIDDAGPIFGFTNDTFNIAFDRPNWIFGAQFALNFNTPF